MLNCTLVEFNHIGLFGFEEEPNLLMCYVSAASAAQAFSMSLRKQNNQTGLLLLKPTKATA